MKENLKQLDLGFSLNPIAITKMHPSAFPVIKPNLLISATDDFKMIDLRIYHEILSINHALEPDKLEYSIPYKNLTDSTNAKYNGPTHVKYFAEALTKKNIYLDEESYFVLTGKREREAYIAPFPVVEYGAGIITIELNRHFKKALILAREHYLSGELMLLRSLKTEASNRLYWAIRQAQRKGKNEIHFQIDALKKLLGLEGQYERYQNFKTRVLDIIKTEFQNKWVEFEFTLVRKGRGGTATGILFRFKPDKELEKELRQSLNRDWQKTLLFKYEFPIGKIQNITKHIAYGSPIIKEKPQVWSEYYVNKTIWLCEMEFNKPLWNTKATKKYNTNGYTYDALFEGWFIDKIEEMHKKEVAVNQLSLSLKTAEMPAKTTEFPLETAKEMWVKSGKVYTFEKFLELSRYKIEGDKVIKLK